MTGQEVNVAGLYLRSGGAGETTYLLLHGLGATGEVWDGLVDLIERNNAGCWLAPDFRGHGRSPWERPYTYGSLMDDLMPLVNEASRLVVVGHSMGGVIGLMLGGSLPNVERVLGIGIKTSWNETELEQMQALSTRPVRWWPTRVEAIERYLKVSGLIGLVSPDSPTARCGVIAGDDGQYRLAADPAIYTVGRPPVAELVQAAGCEVMLACGEHDKMVSAGELSALDAVARELPSLGHNAQVEGPEQVWLLANEPLENNLESP
ncbi:MAG: alpha/beta hydrolase [Pseudomonadota bacterium]|nr:alpha/beta hydrolase [Pseudomonadota bacterium]